ncbi:adventurous gliding motility lipoprotein CglD [Archangium violaceum]|uniref:adventurous gliding motility lipoprotein CglC n=1 Tax=Archangium violaceum TaxID=83451 RepID=UPI00193B82F5|nr:adventurous gliding motility lipoprotein CglC [Archangium violaceum]QRK04671.1 adventurous gliding motility lipoprotein CglD [Archangium violaceum]
MSARLALLVGAALLCGGCEVPSDIGKPCVLVKKSTKEGEKSDPVTLEDIGEGDKDFISFGALDCEELVCVRDANSPIQTSGEGDGLRVLGYCSKACVPSDDGAPQIQSPCAVNHPEASAEVKASMSCRPLLLDQQALDYMRANSPEEYRATFGENSSPYFCAASTPTEN